MNTDKLEAGQELDAKVATEVMGWTLSPDGSKWLNSDGRRAADAEDWIVRNCLDASNYRWSPSTDIRAAWQVIGHGDWFIGNDLVLGHNGSNWGIESVGFKNFLATADTAQLAICRAAIDIAETARRADDVMEGVE